MKHNIKKYLSAAALSSIALFQPVQAEMQTLIVGGQAANLNDFPSTVALLDAERLAAFDSVYQAQMCGGTLIQSNWVLTAAHCVIDADGNVVKPSNLMILAGSNDLNNPIYEPTSVARVIVHEQYINAFVGDDIALLELTQPVTTGAIALNDTPTLTNEVGYIAGWGMLDYAETLAEAQFPTMLQAAQVRTLSGYDCAQLGGSYVEVDAEKQVCAGVQSGGISACMGDSGGPLFTVTSRNTLRLAGITSWGVECGINENQPAVFTNVSYYLNWINNTMGNSTDVVVPKRADEETGNDTDEVTNNDIDEQTTDDTRTPNRLRVAEGGSTGLFFLPLMLAVWLLRRRTDAIDSL